MSSVAKTQVLFFLFSAGVGVAFFVSSLVLLNYGRRLGLGYLAKQETTDKIVGLNTAEGAMFALMGLVLAFAVSGGLQRFDERRQLVLHEANAIDTAYDRLGLIEPEASINLKAKLRDYTEARLELYRLPIDFSLEDEVAIFSSDQQEKIATLKNEIWNAAAAACPPPASRTACALVLPALNSVFEIARLRRGAEERHPPHIIFLMLFSLGLGGSLLAGFGMAAAKTRSWIHMVIFAAGLAFTLFVITDVEFPRLGIVRVDAFDHFIAEVYAQMH